MNTNKGFWMSGVLLALASFVALGAAAEPAAEATPVDAVWVKHERNFTFMGFTSHYSCDGLEYKLKSLLRLSGARDDLKVWSSCSEPRGGPSRIASARMTYWTLVLPGSPQATAPAADTKNLGHAPKELQAAESPVSAVGQWKKVQIRAGRPREFDSGDCELVEQFDREVLADFTLRNHASHYTCIPHQVSLNGIQMDFEVLAPLPKAAAPKPISR